MGSFFIEFRDPLFSIILFFAIIFMITFISYWWGRYRRKEDSRHIDRFLQQFQALPTKNELKVLIASGELSQKSWLLLANSYYKTGEYEKAIEIYQEILSSMRGGEFKEIMFLLAKTYFKAGFLERSKQILLEILKKHPRTPEALHYLLLIHEYMRSYDEAFEVLGPLEELDENISVEAQYLQALKILNNPSLSKEQKTQLLLEIYQQNHNLTAMIFEYLFQVDSQLAWEHLDGSRVKILTQVLWNLEPQKLDLDIISKSGYLRELYTARGDVSLATHSSVFALDILIKLQKKADATLGFEYVCSRCKTTYPFIFYRCSACHAIQSATVDISLIRDFKRELGEENNSFQ